MKEQYDFHKGKRGAVVQPDPKKLRITIRLDGDVVQWFKEQVHQAGGGNYQTRMNQALREYMERQKEPLEELFRRILREELKTANQTSST